MYTGPCGLTHLNRYRLSNGIHRPVDVEPIRRRDLSLNSSNTQGDEPRDCSTGTYASAPAAAVCHKSVSPICKNKCGVFLTTSIFFHPLFHPLSHRLGCRCFICIPMWPSTGSVPKEGSEPAVYVVEALS